MGIAIFFIIMSIILMIGTTIYVNKHNKFYNFKPVEKKTLNKQKTDIKKIWGIEEIKNNVITVDGQHSIIIELGSIEYRLLNESEQESIDNALTKISKTLKFKMQLFSTIVKVDTREKIKEINENIKKQNNQNMIDYGESIIKYLENIMNEEDLFVRKNYIILSSYEPREKAEYSLKEYYNNLRMDLLKIKITSKLLSDAGIIELLHRELNKNSTENVEKIIKEGGLDFYVKNV